MFFLVARFTFYLADYELPEHTAPTSSEDNIISFLSLTSEPYFSGLGPEEEEPGSLIVSGVTSDGFYLMWEAPASVVYDSYTVECKDTQGLWGVKEVSLLGDAKSTRIQGLKASTEYAIKLYGVTNSEKSSAQLQAVAVTGISFVLKMYAYQEMSSQRS